jgi:hypothetical protein
MQDISFMRRPGRLAVSLRTGPSRLRLEGIRYFRIDCSCRALYQPSIHPMMAGRACRPAAERFTPSTAKPVATAPDSPLRCRRPGFTPFATPPPTGFDTGATVAEVQALLGHASVATTGIYTKTRPAFLAEPTPDATNSPGAASPVKQHSDQHHPDP